MTKNNSNSVTRHQRFFKWVVAMLLILFIGLLFWLAHQKYKVKAERVGEIILSIEDKRQVGEIFPAVQYLGTITDSEFWQSWVFLEKMVAQGLEAPFFYEFAKRYWNKGDVREASFWLAWARFNMSFDAYRCADQSIRKWKSHWDAKLTPVDLQSYINNHSNVLNQSLEDVLDWDQNKAAFASPVYLCRYTNPLSTKMPEMVPPENWGEIHKELRRMSAQFLFEQQQQKEDISND